MKKNKTLGVNNGKFTPCPDSPNCVCTQSKDKEHAITPYTFIGSLEKSKEKIISVINEMPRTKIITNDPLYIHAEFRSKIFRFTDDVEFYFNRDKRIIEFRSASRIGYSDMGVNRKRMEEIRGHYESME